MSSTRSRPPLSASTGLSHTERFPGTPHGANTSGPELQRVPSRLRLRSRSKSLQESLRRTLNTAVGKVSRPIDSPQSAVSAPVLSTRISQRDEKSSRHLSPPSLSRRRTPSPSRLSHRNRVLFYHKHDPHYGFTNFSSHAVYYDHKSYPTSEHLFQSFKFAHRPNLAEHIRTCDPRPSKAFSEARRFQPEVRLDWKEVNVQMMDIALWHKFYQHRDLRAELLDTGNAELVEDSDKDAFWGVGNDGGGRNELGKALERLRAQLRA